MYLKSHSGDCTIAAVVYNAIILNENVAISSQGSN